MRYVGTEADNLDMSRFRQIEIVSDDPADISTGDVLVIQRLQVVSWSRLLAGPQVRQQPATCPRQGVLRSRVVGVAVGNFGILNVEL